MEETVSDRLKEVGMIDVMENKVLGPLIRQRMEQGERKGRSEGKQEGRQDLLQDQLTEKFGSLPVSVLKRLQAASTEALHTQTS